MKNLTVALWIIAGGVIIAVAIFGLLKSNNERQQTAEEIKNIPASANIAITSDDHLLGNEDAKVTLIEYGDYQCPACGAYHPIVSRVIENFGDKITFAYRHFPLGQIHQNAELAARAAEAAGEQGEYWGMHDLLLENQSQWSQSNDAAGIFTEYAFSLSLGVEKFQKDINSDIIKERVENDFQGGLEASVNATPTFFLDGKKLKNPRSYNEFKKLIEQALAE